MNNLKNILGYMFSAIGEKSINNELFVFIIAIMFMMFFSIFGFVFMCIWYIIPSCLESNPLFLVLYIMFSVSTSGVLSTMTIFSFHALIDKKEKK